jgi:phosphate starvation-inducible protein PhoH and related proteins
MKKRKNLLLENNEEQTISNTNDKSPIIPQRSKIKIPLTIFERSDLTLRQKEFIELSLDKKVKLIFVNGPAGTSKTFCAIYCALRLLNEQKVSDILYIRSIVECSDKSIGYLPGSMDEKISNYLEPLYEKLNELIPKNEIESLKKDNRISAIPVGFLRGVHWNVKCIIADESQNMSMKELTTLITRVGMYSKVFVLGDDLQSDINGRSGFSKIINIFDDEESRKNGIYVFRFTVDDIVRSGLVRFIINKLNHTV